MTLQEIETRIDRLVIQAETTVRNARVGSSSTSPAMVTEEWAALRSAGLAFIESTFGRGHGYYEEFHKHAVGGWQSDGKYAFGILKAIQDQIKNGWIEETKGLVSAEVFADFLEMAEHLLDEGYKDPAAVMAGGVLEEHLRQLCPSVSVPTTYVDFGRENETQKG